MTKLFLKGIEAVQGLSAEQQDLAGELLLSLAAEPALELSPQQLEELDLSIAEADRGEFASDDEVAAMWKKFGP
jgi:predicted transcriptional regulator